MFKFVVPALFLVSTVLCDVFMQNPRGSNNRLNGVNANRKNDNRLFDSQNNAKGGYNKGDLTAEAAGADARRYYSMQYYASGPSEAEASKLAVEWTNQHGCGDNPKVVCNIVIQYMCQNNGTEEDHPGYGDPETNNIRRGYYMRDGTATTNQGYRPYNNKLEKEAAAGYDRRTTALFNEALRDESGLHESWWWYETCRQRERNGGLFTADQNLKKDKLGFAPASKTRQNNGGGKSGYECAEERDYYPYWTPTNQDKDVSMFETTPWLDLAWLGDTSKCDYIKQNSYNRNSKFRCIITRGNRDHERYISEESCTGAGGNWVEFTSFLEILDDITSEADCNAASQTDSRNNIFWGKTRSDSEEYKCIVQAPEVVCDRAPTSRVNHLGNAINTEDTGINNSQFHMEMPHFPSGEAKRCVLRLRYNISTTDYDIWNTDSSSNNDDSVIEDNPRLDILGNGEKLHINLNTNQLGRTFQDRSHVFVVLPRTEEMAGKTLYNLNVRGKRGNCEETLPSTEYDFVPNNLQISQNDLLHIQWTGSNTHTNKNDGNSGQGNAGTDRNNLLQMEELGKNMPYSLKDATFWDNVESLTNPDASAMDIAVGFATSGFYCGASETSMCPASETLAAGKEINEDMNNVSPSYFGHVLKFKSAGTLYYMCSRNNNFSNRSQKGALVVA